jgi:hypothetical protein
VTRAKLTAIVLTRHGHGTIAITLDSLREQTVVPDRIVVADIGSPGPVADYLASADDIHHLRIDEPMSRQQARRLALSRIDDDGELVLLVDNNMLLEPSTVEALVAAQGDTGAALVSPLITTYGGAIHFSGGVVVRNRSLRKLGRRVAARPQDTVAAVMTPVQEVVAERTDIDFVESHCALARAQALKRPGVLLESMHNAHTMCFAGHRLRRTYKQRVVLEPSVSASIVPYSLGYDLPWMCLEYMRRDRLASSYHNLRSTLGPGPDTDLEHCLPWHSKHFKFLLSGMLDDDRFARQDLARRSDLPDSMIGYDASLPAGTVDRLRAELLPRIEVRYPEPVASVREWLDSVHQW